jgi:hypothetical protein
MIIHCSRKLAARLPGVSGQPLHETSALGSWHGHLFTIDRRQCVMFCHDLSRYCLFIPGIRKEHFAELGGKWFRQLFLSTLESIGCAANQIRRAELIMGPVRFDTTTDRSVQGSINVARRDLEAWAMHVSNVMDTDPIAVSCRLNERPSSARGELLWPERLMRDTVQGLS